MSNDLHYLTIAEAARLEQSEAEHEMLACFAQARLRRRLDGWLARVLDGHGGGLGRGVLAQGEERERTDRRGHLFHWRSHRRRDA